MVAGSQLGDVTIASEHRSVASADPNAEGEWQRLETTLQKRIKYTIHRRILLEALEPGMTVLDVGSGPGRFAIDIIRAGGRVTLYDLLGDHLAEAERRIGEAGLSDGIAGFEQGDVRDMSRFADGTFDVVLAYGGPVSYVREDYAIALQEIARTTKPGGTALASVMALYGTLRLLGPLDAAKVLETRDDHLPWTEVLGGSQVVLTVPGSREFHAPMALFTVKGLRTAMSDAGLRVTRMATANPIVPATLKAPRLSGSEDASAVLTELEVALCEEPGLLETGEHLIAVAEHAFATP